MNCMEIFLSCFGLSIVSALVPWVNGEVLLLSMTALVRSPFQLAALVFLASSGQMIGKCVLYWAGRGVIPLHRGRIGKVVASCKARLENASSKPMGLVFVSSFLGIPPFYVITVLAGAVRLRFGRFLAIGACGRLLHFAVLAFIPQLAIHLFHIIGGRA